MGKQYVLNFGIENQIFEIPFENVIEGKISGNAKKINDLRSNVGYGLSNLVGNVDLSCLNRDSKVVIVSDDYTRPTPTAEILPEVIRFLNEKGVDPDNISILIGAGFHREMTKEEKIRKFGVDICKEFKIYHHDALDNDNLCYLGDTKSKIPIYINKLAVEADFLIGVGVVEIHPWAGFAGGPKIICPGVAGKKTINYTHALPVTEEKVEIGMTQGNPFWENILEASRMAGLDMVVNVVIGLDEEVYAVFAGDTEEAQKKCIEAFKSFNQIIFDEPADVVITSANPKYQYWGQSAIAGYNATRVLKKGGTRIVLAACPEGFGDSQQEIIFYFDSLKNTWPDLDQYWEERQGVGFDNSRNTCAVHRHLKLLKDYDLLMVTNGFPSSTPKLASLNVVGSIQEALDIAYEKHGEDARVIIYDMGAMVLPTLKKS